MICRPYWRHHDDDIVMFDVPPPLQSRGLMEYKKTWDLFFAYHQPGQAFDVKELYWGASATLSPLRLPSCVAGRLQSVSLRWPGGFQFRLTIGLRKVDGAWRIQHEHHSVPATD